MSAAHCKCQALERPLTEEEMLFPIRTHKLQTKYQSGSSNSAIQTSIESPCQADHVVLRTVLKDEELDPREIETAITMSLQGIGPDVYYHTHKEIIMEMFDGDLEVFLNDSNNSNRIPEAIDHVLGHISTLAAQRWIDIDIKPPNIVYKKDERGRLQVRLIDFDPIFFRRVALKKGIPAAKVSRFCETVMVVLMTLHLDALDQKLNLRQSCGALLSRVRKLVEGPGSVFTPHYIHTLMKGWPFDVYGMTKAYFHLSTHDQILAKIHSLL